MRNCFSFVYKNIKRNNSFFTIYNKSMNSTSVKIESLDSSKTPKAIGPYSKATRVEMGDKYMIFCSGSLGSDPTTGNLISDDVGEQTKQALENMKNLLEYL
jgi:enamine deaminase RidA (YjgF/YER057c/UK114 family)